VNIYGIAEKAGVSIATVSRVVNQNGPVSPATARKVLAVIEEMGYRPNIFAKGLTTNSIRLIGVLTTDISDLYFATAIHMVEQNAKKHGYDILLSCTEPTVEDKKRHIDLLAEKRVDGIILIGSIFREAKNNAHIEHAAARMPVVTLNSLVEGRGIHSVYCDDGAGTAEAVGHLAAGGRRRIAYAYDVATFSGMSKLAGYRRAMEQAGLAPQEVQCKPGIAGGMEAAQAILAQNPGVDGILCAEDQLAVGVLQELIGRGRDVPGQVAVVGYNDSLLARCTNPELASVDGKVRSMSAYAFDTMLKAIETGEAPQKTVVTPELVIRRSAML